MERTYHEAPLVPKIPVSLIVLEWSGLESTALRGMLEYFGYRVDMHWVGSRKEFVEILKGNILTNDLMILSCHGYDGEGMFTCPDERPMQPEEIAKTAKLKGKTVLSLGCHTGTDDFANAFLKAGCAAYVAPEGAPFGNTALLFAVHACYELYNKESLKQAVHRAASFNADSALFRLWQKP